MGFLLKWLELRRLLLLAYLLLWPPLLILAARQSHQPEVLGWWSKRVFLYVATGLAVLILFSVLLIWCWRSDAMRQRMKGMFRALRRFRLVAVLAAVIPIAAWLFVLCYLEVIAVRPSVLLLIALADLALLVAVWEAALMFVGRKESLRRALLKRVLLACTALVLAIVTVEVVGNARGLAAYAGWDMNPKNLTTVFRTEEFRVTIVTNSQGLRETNDVAREHPGIFRVVVVGDSMTFGWGVENHQAYPKVAELLLHTKLGVRNVEVINMGKPGAAPHDYLKFMRQYAAELKPDLVVVGFLIGNDCPVAAPAQLTDDAQVQLAFEKHVAQSHVDPVERVLLKSYLLRLYYSGLSPRLRSLGLASSSGERGPIFGEPNPLDPDRLQGEIARAHDPQGARQRLQRLREQGLVEQGRHWYVNPWLLRSIVLHPTGPADSLAVRQETRAVMHHEWQLCENLIREMKSAATESGAETMVLAIPHKHAVSKDWLEFLRRNGCEAPDEMLTATTINEWLRKSCAELGITCVDTTARLRSEFSQGGAPLYWSLDDHLTPEGQRLVGQLLAESLLPMIPATEAKP